MKSIIVLGALAILGWLVLAPMRPTPKDEDDSILLGPGPKPRYPIKADMVRQRRRRASRGRV